MNFVCTFIYVFIKVLPKSLREFLPESLLIRFKRLLLLLLIKELGEA